MDPARHEDWATEIPDGYERGEHNRGGTRWTAHALGHDDEFLAATARHPDALAVVEALIGGPVKLPGRNRGIYAIFPQSQGGGLGPHVDSHTFECQMVTYLGPVGDDSGGKLLPSAWGWACRAYQHPCGGTVLHCAALPY